MTTTTYHRCPAHGCVRSISSDRLACRVHWFRVSKATRDRVWFAYNADDGDHADAVAQAVLEMNR